MRANALLFVQLSLSVIVCRAQPAIAPSATKTWGTWEGWGVSIAWCVTVRREQWRGASTMT